MTKNKQIETIYSEIFELSSNKELGVYKAAANLGYSDEKHKLLFLKELTQQIICCRKNMIETFNEDIIYKITQLNLNVKAIQTPEFALNFGPK